MHRYYRRKVYMKRPMYLTSSHEVAREQKKAKTFRGYKYIKPTHYDYGETVGSNLCLNPQYAAKLLYKINRNATKAYIKFFKLYPTWQEKVEAVVNI